MFEQNLKELDWEIANCVNPPFEDIIIEIKEFEEENILTIK